MTHVTPVEHVNVLLGVVGVGGQPLEVGLPEPGLAGPAAAATAAAPKSHGDARARAQVVLLPRVVATFY